MQHVSWPNLKIHTQPYVKAYRPKERAGAIDYADAHPETAATATPLKLRFGANGTVWVNDFYQGEISNKISRVWLYVSELSPVQPRLERVEPQVIGGSRLALDPKEQLGAKRADDGRAYLKMSEHTEHSDPGQETDHYFDRDPFQGLTDSFVWTVPAKCWAKAKVVAGIDPTAAASNTVPVVTVRLARNDFAGYGNAAATGRIDLVKSPRRKVGSAKVGGKAIDLYEYETFISVGDIQDRLYQKYGLTPFGKKPMLHAEVVGPLGRPGILWDKSQKPDWRYKSSALVFGFELCESPCEMELLQSQPGGLFEVRSGAAAPHVVAQFGWDEVWNTETVGFTVVNNADDVLVLDQAFVRPSGTTKSYFLFSGTGDIRIDGTATTASPRIRLGLTEGARLVWNAVGKTFEKFEATVGADGVLELGKDVTITCGGGYYKFQVGDNKGAARLCVTGEGALEFGAVPKSTARTGGGLYMDGPINVGNADSVLTLDVDMLSTYYKLQDYYASAYFSGPAGSAVIVRTNELRGCVKLLGSSSGACLSVASIGLGKEVPSFLGYADILAAGDNVLRYTGPGETCDRSLFITNKAPVQANQDDGARVQKAQIWQDGTGPLVWH